MILVLLGTVFSRNGFKDSLKFSFQLVFMDYECFAA